MARIRTTKPLFWGNECLGRMSTLARLTFLGLKDNADDHGRGQGDFESIWSAVHRHAHRNVRAALVGALRELGAGWGKDGLEILSDLEGDASRRRATRWQRGGNGVATRWQRHASPHGECCICGKPHVVFYKVDGRIYYWLPGFSKHQRVDRKYPSQFPEPPYSTNPRDPFNAVTTTTEKEVVVREEGTPRPTPEKTPDGVLPVVAVQTTGKEGTEAQSAESVTQTSPFLERINPRRSLELLISIGVDPSAAGHLSKVHAVGVVFDAVQASKTARDRGAWTRAALERGYRLPPPDAGEMGAFLRLLEADHAQVNTIYRPTPVRERRPFQLPGESERDAVVRLNEEMRRKREEEATGKKEGVLATVMRPGPLD